MKSLPAKKIFPLFFALLAVVLIFTTAHQKASGQSSLYPGSVTTDAFEIKFSPATLTPNIDATAQILTYSFDTDVSYITWAVNGKIVAQGRGKKSITFKTGNLGSALSISAVVTTETGRETSKKLSFTIGEVDLLWQAFSHTPVFYKGKAWPTIGTPVKITALPQGLGDSKNLIYEWKRDFKIAPDASGVGKDSFLFTFSQYFDEEDITLTVWGPKKEFSLTKLLTIKRKSPVVVFYEENSLEGPLYQRVLWDNILLLKPELVIRAEPYFYPQKDISNLVYTWKMNEKEIKPISEQNIIGLSAPQNTSGASIISLELKNPAKFLQQTTKQINLTF